MQKNIYTLHGQKFYWDGVPGIVGLPFPIDGSFKQVGEFHICLFPDGSRWVSWADRRDASLITYTPTNRWNFHDHQGDEYDGTPSKPVLDAVYSTLLAVPKDMTYHGHGPFQAQQDLQDRMSEALNPMITPLPEGSLEAFKNGVIEELGVTIANPNGVIRGTFTDVPASSTMVDVETGDLIPIDNSPGNRFPVNARDLHAYLEIGRDFSNWFKDRRDKFQLIENVDYVIDSPDLANQTGRGGDRRSKEYRLTPTAARWLAADVNSEKGREMIKFLVAVAERAASGVLALPQTYAEALRALADSAEVTQQLKLENQQAQQVIGETKVELEIKEAELSDAEREIRLLMARLDSPVHPVSITEYAKDMEAVLGVSSDQFFDLLKYLGILCKGEKRDEFGDPYYTTTVEYGTTGWFRPARGSYTRHLKNETTGTLTGKSRLVKNRALHITPDLKIGDSVVNVGGYTALTRHLLEEDVLTLGKMVAANGGRIGTYKKIAACDIRPVKDPELRSLAGLAERMIHYVKVKQGKNILWRCGKVRNGKEFRTEPMPSLSLALKALNEML